MLRNLSHQTRKTKEYFQWRVFLWAIITKQGVLWQINYYWATTTLWQTQQQGRTGRNPSSEPRFPESEAVTFSSAFTKTFRKFDAFYSVPNVFRPKATLVIHLPLQNDQLVLYSCLNYCYYILPSYFFLILRSICKEIKCIDEINGIFMFLFALTLTEILYPRFHAASKLP